MATKNCFIGFNKFNYGPSVYYHTQITFFIFTGRINSVTDFFICYLAAPMPISKEVTAVTWR